MKKKKATKKKTAKKKPAAKRKKIDPRKGAKPFQVELATAADPVAAEEQATQRDDPEQPLDDEAGDGQDPDADSQLPEQQS
jgi:hypothetical protein